MLPPNPNKDLTFDPANLRDLYLAGGCFWGVDAYMERVPGVYYTESGYANGFLAGPVTYEEVCTETKGHAETVYLQYDPTKIELDTLLDQFFEVINPTTLNRQAGDIGTRYRTGIYTTADTTADDVAVIFTKLAQLQAKYDKPVVTEVTHLRNYHKAEEYHQNYLEKNPGGYCHISFN